METITRAWLSAMNSMNVDVKSVHTCWAHLMVLSTPLLKHTHTHTHTRLTAIFPGLPRSAGTRKEKPIWILLKQETMSGNGISWAICKSAPRSRQITMPATHRSVFTGQMPFLLPNQQRPSTEGLSTEGHYSILLKVVQNNKKSPSCKLFKISDN